MCDMLKQLGFKISFLRSLPQVFTAKSKTADEMRGKWLTIIELTKALHRI